MSIAWLCPGGYSAADWNVGVHVGAVEISGAGSICRSVGLATIVAAAGTMTDESSTRCLAIQNRVLDNRDLCRIISSFIPADKE